MTPEAAARLGEWVMRQRALVPVVAKCAQATAWHFDVERDSNGLMTGITAIPVPLPAALADVL